VEPSVADIYMAVAKRYGSRLTKQEIQQRFGTAFSRHQDGGPTNEAHERDRWQAIVAEVLDDISNVRGAPFEELWKLFSLPQQWSLFDDVVEAWSQLERRGLILGIASNFDQRLHKLCQLIAPLNHARRIFVSSEVGFPKPHPEFFRRIEADLQAEPAQILLVGDSVTHDVEGARSAGWHGVHLNRDATDQSWQTISSLRQLPNFL
jgi:putative hydrolase of the HAD superfamily